jgi:hypothetical protein
MMEKSNTNTLPNEAPGEANSTRRRTPSIVAWGITGLLVAVIAAVIVFAGRRNVEEPAPPKKKLVNVEVVTVSTEEYREALTLPALVEADRTAAIRPESPGTLARWFFPEGATVERGQIVAELDIDILMANLEELKAALKTASENATLSGIGTESASLELENTQKRAKVQELALKSAEANRELAMTEFTRIQTLVEKKSTAFLMEAFFIAIFIISMVLVIQFNSILIPLIVLASVVLSLIGVFTGLLIFDMPFGIIMSGIGVISLAGVVVNNSIVLLDAIRQFQRRGHSVYDALVTAGMIRFRPVLLTATTTILGLVPMAFKINIDFANLSYQYNTETSQYWQSMAVAIIFGLLIATLLTLGVVPTLYLIYDRLKNWVNRTTNWSVAEEMESN